jgi:hypothetical protein
MQTNLKWDKGTFSNTYNIYSQDQVIGKLRNSSFSQIAEGELNGKKYTFITKGFFNQQTEIRDAIDNKLVGNITYNGWMTKATLSILDKKINWKYDNLWNTKWSIFDSNGIEIKYSGSSSKGQINSNTNDDLLILSGLFVTNYYWQITIVLIIVASITIWTTVLN